MLTHNILLLDLKFNFSSTGFGNIDNSTDDELEFTPSV